MEQMPADNATQRVGPVLLAGGACAWLAASAWHKRFLCDDAFISFRYARNLVEGQRRTRSISASHVAP